MATEERVSRLEGAYEQVDARLNDLGRSIGSLRAEMNSGLNDMSRSIDSLRAEMNSRFNNILILLGGSWVTIIIAVIGLYFKD